MSTRSVIARKDGFGFAGRYHYWDGYPTGLGWTLFHLWREHFKKDTDAMLKVLIDDHPAGWSTIVKKDFRLDPGFVEDPAEDVDTEMRPQCYCHGDRSEKAQPLLTENTASGVGCEYAYVLTGNSMQVYSSYSTSGEKMIGAFGMGDEKAKWKAVEVIDLDGPEPDWEGIDTRARA